MVAAGIRVLAGSHQAMARLWPSAAIGGLVALGVGLYTAVTIRDQLVETLATELPMAEVERALDSGLLEPRSIGLYLVIAGASRASSRRWSPWPRNEPVASSGAGLRGWSSLDEGAHGPTDPARDPRHAAPPSGRVPNEGGEPPG